MVDENKPLRVPVILTPEEVQQLEDWQFANRQKTRSDAIRRALVQAGALTERPPGIGKRGRPAVVPPTTTAMPTKPKRGGK